MPHNIKPENKCIVCKRDLGEDLQGLLLGVCSGSCARQAEISDDVSDALYSAYDRISYYWHHGWGE